MGSNIAQCERFSYWLIFINKGVSFSVFFSGYSKKTSKVNWLLQQIGAKLLGVFQGTSALTMAAIKSIQTIVSMPSQ